MSGSNIALRTLLGGWQWTGIFSAYTGDAITIVAGTDRSETALGDDRAFFIGNSSQYGGVAPSGSRTGCGSATCVPWLNTSVFTLPGDRDLRKRRQGRLPWTWPRQRGHWA